MDDSSGLVPPRLEFPPLPSPSMAPSSAGAAPTANGLLSMQSSPAALEVSEAQKANLDAAARAGRMQLLREAGVEQDRSKVVLPALHAWQTSRPSSRRIAYPATCAKLGAVGLATYSVVHRRGGSGEPRATSSVFFEAAGHAVLGGVCGWLLGTVVDDVSAAVRPPALIPLRMPTEVRAFLVQKHQPLRWRLEGWLASWGELAEELNAHSAVATGASAGFSEVASLMKVMRG